MLKELPIILSIKTLFSHVYAFGGYILSTEVPIAAYFEENF